MGYLRKFNSDIVLTSKNPEAFANFEYDGSVHWIIPHVKSGEDISIGNIYVNGLDINAYTGTPSLGYALQLDATYNIASFHIYSGLNHDDFFPLEFLILDNSALILDGSLLEYVYIKNRPYTVNNGLNTYPISASLVDDETSYMVLRTNPKFTGNITLNIDCSENMFLDTFHVSDILSNKKYRKQQVSANSVLSSDIRKTFASLPLGELYKVSANNTLNISIPKTELFDQFDQTYNYGAKLLLDELYSEDNGILAPLWINSKLPDYFALFRLAGVYNQETYDGDSLDELAFKYLEESEIIRAWDMKLNAPIGKYLSTHLSDIVRAQSPVFLSLSDPSAIDSDPNTWYGIAVDKGVLAGRSETTYFFNEKANNYTDLNSFVSQGFERNNLLCPNLINMNFIFDDNDVSLYTMNRYFGLYLTENVLYNVAYYAENSDSSISIISLDGKVSSDFFASDVFVDGSISDEYKNRLFVLNDGDQLKRIRNVNEIDGTKTNEYVNKPYKNIFSTKVDEIHINPFVLFTLNTALQQGEHLRIVRTTSNPMTIWEVYGTDVSNYNCDRYVTVTDASGIYPTVYRTYFDVNGDIEYQVKEISKAFDLFAEYEDAPFGTNGVYGKDWVSIMLNENINVTTGWYFHRITGSTLNDFNDPNSGFNTIGSVEDFSFYGVWDASPYYEYIPAYNNFGPIDFEFFGGRETLTLVPFVFPGSRYIYSFDSSQNILDKFEEPTLYQGIDGRYRKLSEIGINIGYDSTWQYVKDPTSISDKVIIMTTVPMQTIKSYYNAYNIYPLSISLMGINPVKDIDFTVNDPNLGTTNEYNYNREFDASTYYFSIKENASTGLSIKGSFVIERGTGTIYQDSNSREYEAGTLLNTFDSSVILAATSDTLLTYAIIDGTHNYSVAGGNSDVSINDYYYSNDYLKYGLTVPYVAKWVGLGNDARNNPLRLMLNGSTNFIPTSTEFNQELSYPSFKYLSSGGRSWEDYVFYDVNDVIDSGLTIKEAMFANPFDDYFSKLIYTNYGVDATKTRSSICYYNAYKSSIDVIILGLSLSIRVESAASSGIDIKNYDRYKFSFVSTASKNKNSNRSIELIVNENTRTILMIWYQGNDELNYNKRYSSILPGKSLMDPSNNGFVHNDRNFSFIKTPFIVNNSTIQKTIENIYGIDTFLTALSSPYAQFNKNVNLYNSAWNAWGSNVIADFAFLLDATKTFETFDQVVNYGYLQDANTHGNYVVNYGYKYNENHNAYLDNTTNYDTLQTLLATSRNYVMYYVIRENEIISSLDFGSVVNPMSITINHPRTYLSSVVYTGWYKPKFNNILEFKSNEEESIINIVKKDFVLGNTNLRIANPIPQVWYNEVVSNVTSSDSSNGNAISYITNYNVFKSLWDADYYIKDNVPVDGFENSAEMSSYFGSKLPKLPNTITLENWDVTSTSYTSTSANINLSYNITRAISALFKGNTEFLNNWANFNNSTNAIANYIKNTILGYYNISQPKIQMNYYYKPFDGTLLHLVNDNDFINDNKQNFNAQLAYINEEYIYNIAIPKTGNFSYFVSLTLSEK